MLFRSDLETWQNLLSSCIALNVLVFDATCEHHIDPWIRSLSPEELEGRAYPAPALHTLCVTIRPDTANENLLMSVVRSRYGTGHPVHTLHVKCDAPDETRSGSSKRGELEEFVEELKFDDEHTCVDLASELRDRFNDDSS